MNSIACEPLLTSNRVAALLAPAKPRHSILQGASVERIKVLVVDDCEDSTMVLAKLLRLLGYDVEIAFDGLQGLDRVSEFKPQCAIVDIGLPRLNGLEMARQIRLLPGGRDMSLIAITGMVPAEEKQSTSSAGFDHYMRKPIDIPTLCRLLPQALD